MASSKHHRRMRARIEALNDDERRQLYKRAANMRRAAERGPSKAKHRERYDDLGEDDGGPAFEKRRRRYKGSLRQWAELLLDDDAVGATAGIDGVAEPTRTGTVLFAASGTCRVLLDSNEDRECLVAPDLAASQRSDLAVGDRVEVRQAEAPDDLPQIVGVLPRTSVLSRPDSGPGGQRTERVVAANIDRALIVASVQEPPLRPRLIDRYLVAIESGGARAAVAVTKIDLLAAAPRSTLLESLAPYAALGVPVIPCSSRDGEGVDELAELLRSETAVFVGQSGVGKSSLLNALEPTLEITTRDVGRQRKGRHTTTASTLYELAEGTRIVDTPGVREFGLWRLSRTSLRRYFHDFDAFAADCRFGDCSHTHEPDCGVARAVAAGGIPAARYESYRRLLETLPAR